MARKFTIKKLRSVVSDALQTAINPQSTPLVYFDEIMNVGDLVSPYLVEKITMRPTHRARTSLLPRLLGVGSILGNATPNAYVWGSGLMSPSHACFSLTSEKVSAVRGKKTRDFLFDMHNFKHDLALGDPALLMPCYYRPRVSAVSDRIGIIPHYVDYALASQLISAASGAFCLIDVRQKPEAFIDELLTCSAVMSSSLHGLILADAYKIPNAWVRFSGNIGGGSWKFNDYYSTTVNPDRCVTEVKSIKDVIHMACRIEKYFTVSDFQESLDELVGCFPSRYLNEEW